MKTIPEKPHRLTFRISDELHALLESVANREKRTVNAQVELYVENALKAEQQSRAGQEQE